MRPSFIAVACAAVALSLPGCATFQPNPTADACAKAQSQLQTAQEGFAWAQFGLALARDAGAHGDALDKAQTALNLAQTVLDRAAAERDAKCPRP